MQKGQLKSDLFKDEWEQHCVANKFSEILFIIF